MAKQGRVADAIINQRVNDVYVFLLKGSSRQEIIQHSAEEWDIGERQADKYIEKARKYFNERLRIERDTELGQSVTRYEMLFQKALKVQDYKTAIQAQSRIDKVMGLEQTTVTIKTWQDDAIKAIQEGEITPNDYDILLATVKSMGESESLAVQLFKQAGVELSLNED